MMTYTISRAEQVLQTQRQALNLRWYPHYHLAARRVDQRPKRSGVV